MIWTLLTLGVGIYLFAQWLSDDKLQFEPDEHKEHLGI